MVVGAGIFRSPSEIAAHAGSATWFFAAWLAGGVITLIGALCFAELASYFRATGGPIRYATEAFGPFLGFQAGWLFYVARATTRLAEGPDGRGMGYAIEVEEVGGVTRYRKGGNTSSYGAYLLWSTSPPVGVAVMTNCGGFRRVVTLAEDLYVVAAPPIGASSR